MSNQEVPQSKFLQAYEKLAPLVSQLRIDVSVQGVFAVPDEWKNLDEANPGVFNYQVRYLDSELSGGKVIPRELTEKEKKDIEDQLLAAKAKKAPPPKKDKNYQEPQINPEEEERLRKIKEAEEEEERLRLIEWNKLDDDTKFYRTMEDRFKNPQILFNEKSDFSFERDGQNLVIMEEHVWIDGGEHIFVVKQPAMSEDDLVKLRKSKPKNLPNLNDLYPVVLQGWIDYRPFREQGIIESKQRIRLTQYIDEQSAPETPKPNLEAGLYIQLTILLNIPVSPVLKEPRPTMQDVIALAPGLQPLHPSQQCIKELRGELELIMESLAMEYSNMFSKELNQFQDSKMNNMLQTHKKADLQKRKELFLYDFNVSGKYKILKERIKKSIVKICRDKFGKSGAITGITTGAEDQFYSELYVFMMEEMRRVIIDMVKDKKEALIEDQLLTKEYAEKNIDAQLVQATKEVKFDVMSRLAEEYEVLNQTEKANKHFKQLIDLNPSDHMSLYHYALFALRAGNYQNAEELIEKALSYNNSNKDYQILLAAIYMQRDKQKEATMIIRLLLVSDPNNLHWNLQLYFLVSKQGDNELLKRKIFAKCERIVLRQKTLLKEQRTHKSNPNIFDIPWIKLLLPPAEKVEKDKAILEKMEQQRILMEMSHLQPKLNKEQFDEMFLKTVKYYDEFNLLDSAETAALLIMQKDLPEMILLSAKLATYHKNPTLAIQIMDAYINQNPRSYQVLQAKGNLQYQNGQLELCEETFLRALKLEEGKTNFNLYLRLGNLFLNKFQYGDARAFFTKACELKPTSSLSWLGLGIACNKSELFADAEQSLMQANILEPQNGEILAYLSLNALQDGGRFEDANQALRELSKTDVLIDQVELLAQLSTQFCYSGYHLTANKVMLQVLQLCEHQDKPQEQITIYQMEMAEIYYKLGQLQNAKELFQEVLPRLQSMEQQQKVREQIEKLEYQQLIQN